MHLNVLIRRQHGVVTTSQAAAAGMSKGAIRWKVTKGHWRRLYPGVFVTHTGPISWHTRAAAALASAGPGAVLGHRSALAVWGLCRRPHRLTIVVPSRRQPRVPGVFVHRTRCPERQVVDGLAVTPLARTILDIADLPGARLDDVISWCARACQQRLTTPEQLRQALKGRRAHRRRAQLRLILGDVAEGVESLAEYRFLRNVVRAHGLPKFRTQVRRGQVRADFDNQEFGVRAEVDGQLWHAGDRFHADRLRDRKSTAQGVATVRATWWDVSDRPCDLAVDLGKTFATRGWTGRLVPCSAHCAVTDSREAAPRGV
jgi:very-short-patch-repair endonuclease